MEEKDGVFTVTLDSTRGGRTAAVTTLVSDKGLFKSPPADDPKAEPRPLLKLTAKAGDTWEAVLPGSKLTAAYTMGPEEEVEVPAGKYKARRVSWVLSQRDGSAQQTTMWYAAGVGMVKQKVAMVGRDAGDGPTIELKSFTPGKGEKKGEPKKDK